MEEYVLVDGVPAREPDIDKWLLSQKDHAARKVNETTLRVKGRTVAVHTAFLGVSYEDDAKNRPLCFETMIFGLTGDNYQARYATREDALAGHEIAVEHAERALEDYRPSDEIHGHTGQDDPGPALAPGDGKPRYLVFWGGGGVGHPFYRFRSFNARAEVAAFREKFGDVTRTDWLFRVFTAAEIKVPEE